MTMDSSDHSAPLERFHSGISRRIVGASLATGLTLTGGLVTAALEPPPQFLRDTLFFLSSLFFAYPLILSGRLLKNISRWYWIAPVGGVLVVISQALNFFEEFAFTWPGGESLANFFKDLTIYTGMVLLFPSMVILLLKLQRDLSREVVESTKKDRVLALTQEEKELVAAQTEILDLTSEGFLLTDRENRIVWFSQRLRSLLNLPEGETLTGISRTEMVERFLIPALGAEDSGMDRMLQASGIASQDTRFLLHLLNTGEGEERWIEYRQEAILSGFYEGGLIEHFKDITEQKKVETALVESSRLEATATLAGGIAHDFNNLMAGVMGNAELLRDEVEEGCSQAEMLDAIIESAERAGNLATQMLHFARGGGYFPREVNLNQVVQEVLKFRQEPAHSSIQILVDLQPNLPLVWADAAQFHEILNNLLANAREALPEGGRIWIRTGSQTAPGAAEDGASAEKGSVTLVVEDNGTGMDEATKAHVFEPFFTTKFAGRGIGLAAVYGIVGRHQGRVEVESALGEGTRVTVTLPIYQLRSQAETLPSPPVADGQRTVLLIEDEDLVRGVTQNLLEANGYHVLSARNGKEGVETAEKYRGNIDLALLDIAMPVMNGSQAFPLLREGRPEMPVILFSGYDRDQSVQALLEQGAASFLRKPVHVDKLIQEIEKVLSSAAATK
jgi:signal transduction histidine kinase/CheY-like chemotaxis protein